MQQVHDFSNTIFVQERVHVPKKMKAKLTLVGQLLEAISKVDRPGTVCTGDDLPLVMPGLEGVRPEPTKYHLSVQIKSIHYIQGS